MSGPEYEGKLPPCDYRDALVKIASRFNQSENMYWTTDLRILFFEKIRETALRPWAANAIHAASAAGWWRSPTAANMPSTIRCRGHRHDRRQLGRRVVRGRARSQLVVRTRLQDGAAVT